MSNVVEFPQYDLDAKMAQKIYAALYVASTPDDVLALAKSVWVRSGQKTMDGFDLIGQIEPIAQAIMTERARCALLLHERYTGNETGEPIDPAIFEIIEAMLRGDDE